MECPHLSKGDIAAGFDLKELEAKLKNGLVCSGKNMQKLHSGCGFPFVYHESLQR